MQYSYKHSLYRGFGLRTLADVVVMLGALEDGAHWGYVEAQASELGISGFAARLHNLAEAVRDGASLTGDQLDAVTRMMLSSTYGNDAEAYRIRMRRYASEGRSPRLAELRRFFSLESVQGQREFDAFRDHPVLRPLFPFVRVAFWLRKSLRDPALLRAKLEALLHGGGANCSRTD